MYRSIKICGRNFGTHDIRIIKCDFEKYLEFVTIAKKLRKNESDVDELYIIEKDIHGEVFRLTIYPYNMDINRSKKYILSKEEWIEKSNSEEFFSDMISFKD